jgi:hypothetical protein
VTFNPPYQPPRKRKPECFWCGSRQHVTVACDVSAEVLKRREAIAERQCRSWVPRERL